MMRSAGYFVSWDKMDGRFLLVCERNVTLRHSIMGTLGVTGCWVTANGRATCKAVQSKTTTKRPREAAQCIMGGPLPGDNFDSRFSVLNIFF